MPSENNHIDHFFRLKSQESSAVNSNVEKDWSMMQELLKTSVVVPASRLVRPMWKYVAYAASVVGIAITVYAMVVSSQSANNPAAGTSKTEESLQSEPSINRESLNVNSDIKKEQKPATIGLKPEANNSIGSQLLVKEKGSLEAGNSVVPDQTLTDPILTAKEQSKESSIEPLVSDRTLFNLFYQKLEKKAELFTISTHRDTTITCDEGTTVFIPAHSFETLDGAPVSGKVMIAIKEFYSFGDIISNKLVTYSGDQLLETGGILHIAATSDNKILRIKPGAQLDLRMPTRQFDANMELFIGTDPNNMASNSTASTPATEKPQPVYDAVRGSGFNTTSLDWIPVGQSQYFYEVTQKNIVVMDLMDNPYSVTKQGKKTIAKFRIPFNSKSDPDVVKKELEKRYGAYYDEIRVKKEHIPLWNHNRVYTITDWYTSEKFVGDTVSMPLYIASRLKLVSQEDSIKYEAMFEKQLEEVKQQRMNYAAFLQKRNDYIFRISNLGWFNCQRYANYAQPKLTEYVVEPGSGFDENTFTAMLIFERERLAITGKWENGNIVFPKLPLGQPCSIICTGLKNGKMMSAVKQTTITKAPVNDMVFEETSPAEFKEKLRQFGNVSLGY